MTNEIKNAGTNPGCGNREWGTGTDVLDARCLSYIDADGLQERKNTIRRRPCADIIDATPVISATITGREGK